MVPTEFRKIDILLCYLNNIMDSNLDIIKKQFINEKGEVDLTPPYPNKRYNFGSFIGYRQIGLIHKLVFFPHLLKEYIPNHTDEIILKTSGYFIFSDGKEFGGYTCIELACINNIVESVKILLPYVDINEETTKSTLLMISCRCLAYDVIKLLLTQPKIDVNLTYYDFSPICYFLSNCQDTDEYLECLDLLLSHPDIKLCDSSCIFNQKLNINVLKRVINHPSFKIDNTDSLDGKLASLYLEERKQREELQRLRELDLGSLLYHAGKKYI